MADQSTISTGTGKTASIIGFAVMAFAPMPIFVTFGTLTAVMIVFSLLVALLVLPSVLLVVTRSRTGAERQHLLDLTGVAPATTTPTPGRPQFTPNRCLTRQVAGSCR